MHDIPRPGPALDAAIREANRRIREIVRGYPGNRLPPPGQRDGYDAAVERYSELVRARDQARGREGEDEEAQAA